MLRRSINARGQEFNLEELPEHLGGGFDVEREVFVAQTKVGRLGVEFIETRGQLARDALSVSRPVVGAAGEKRPPRRKDAREGRARDRS